MDLLSMSNNSQSITRSGLGVGRNVVNSNQPLATRMRPNSLSDVIGQDHLVGKGKVLSRMVDSEVISSIILYGPPGIGKTSIAHALSCDLDRPFEYFNASIHSKKDLEESSLKGSLQSPVVIMIDEVHRLTKPNQDFLLMKLEEGSIVMIGATTENPYMSINPALRSRSQTFELKAISSKDIEGKLRQALEDEVRGLGAHNPKVDDKAIKYIASFTNGDVRSALNTLELAVMSTEPNEGNYREVGLDVVKTCLQQSHIDGDSDGDAHYNLLSAFQKSIRGSDVDASLHYLARLIKIGDLVSINRRLLVIAYEDIGLANPELVGETLSAIESTERVGFPEAKIILAYIVSRLSLSQKSNVAYKGIELATKALEVGRDTGIPSSLHDTHYKGAKDLGKGEGYKYAHDYPHGVVEQQFLPDEFINDRYLVFRDKSDTKETREIYNKLNEIIKPNKNK